MNKILDIIVGRVVSFLFFFRPMQLCSSLSYTSFDFACRPSFSSPLPTVLFPLLLFAVLLVEEARKNALGPRISLGMLFITNPCVFLPVPPVHLLIMISRRNLDLENLWIVARDRARK